MRKASFSVEKVTSNTDAHNTREHSPKYLIGCEKGKENEYIKYYDYDNFQQLAEARYLEVNKQKMQTSQKEALFEEAVISLEEHHTKDDVVKLFESLNKKYTGHTLINLAIHRDEGHFVKDGIEYYPTMHILQKKDGNWYILDENDTEILEALEDKDFKPKAEDFKVKVKIKDFKKVYNYHAHAVFSRFDLETGKSARFQKSTMSERYKFVAEQMQLKYAPDENRLVKKSIGQHKADLSATRNAKLVMKKELEQVHLEEKNVLKKENTSLKSQNTKNKNEKQKLKEELEALKEETKQLRADLQVEKAEKEAYQQLDYLNKQLQEQLKTGRKSFEEAKREVEDLREKLIQKEEDFKEVEDLKKENEYLKSSIEMKEIDIIDFKTQNKSLQEQKEVLEEKVTTLEEKIVSRTNMSDSELKKELQNIINDEIEVKSVKTGVFSTEEAPVIKNSKSFLQKIQDLTVQGTAKVKQELQSWKNKYNDLLEVLKSKDKEIDSLKEKVLELSTKQQKEKSKDHLAQLVKQMEAETESKSDSSNLEKIKEVQEEEIKGKIRRDR